MSSNGWNKYKLGDIVNIKHGFAFKGEFFSDTPTDDILLTPGNFKIGGGFKGDKFKFYNGEYPEEYILKANDVIVTMTDLSKEGDTLGYSALVPETKPIRLLHNQRLGLLQFKRDDFDKHFIYWLLRTKPYQTFIVNSASGSTVKHTSPSRIQEYEFEAPDIFVQRRIADMLSALDEKIELNRQTNATLEALAQSIFREWFVEFNFPGATGEMVESELGMIPQGWRVGSIGEIADVVDCLHSKKPERQKHGQIFLQLNNIRDDGLVDLADAFYISENDYQKWISRIEASKGDCIITNVGRVGAVAQIPPGLSAALGRNMTAIRCKAEYPFPTFLISCLLSDFMREEIGRKTDSGTILDALNVKNIPLLCFPLAPKPILDAFEKSIRPIREQMETNLSQSATLASLRDALLPKLMSGEVAVHE